MTPRRDGAWRLDAFGARFRLTGEVALVATELAAALPGSSLAPEGGGPRPRPDVTYRIAADGAGGALRLLRGRSELARGARDEVLRRAVDALHFDVALHARSASFLHASVVRWEGLLLVFPGRTGAGKSTLAARLAERGATYYSDEYAPIDSSGRILPYRKAISLRPDVRGLTGVGSPEGGEPEAAPPAAVVLTSFRPHARFRPRPLTVEAAALALLDNSVVAVPRPRRAAAAVARLLSHRPRLAGGPRGEAAEFLEGLERWLAAAP